VEETAGRSSRYALRTPCQRQPFSAGRLLDRRDVRAGTTTLFAALEVATGKVIGSLHRRHRAVEFKKFLAKLDKEVPADLVGSLPDQDQDWSADQRSPPPLPRSALSVLRGRGR
jgi:hypothetical protein